MKSLLHTRTRAHTHKKTRIARRDERNVAKESPYYKGLSALLQKHANVTDELACNPALFPAKPPPKYKPMKPWVEDGGAAADTDKIAADVIKRFKAIGCAAELGRVQRAMEEPIVENKVCVELLGTIEEEIAARNVMLANALGDKSRVDEVPAFGFKKYVHWRYLAISPQGDTLLDTTPNKAALEKFIAGGSSLCQDLHMCSHEVRAYVPACYVDVRM